ncbi:MAG: hypothetical protein ABI797_05995 [Chloroflexota bacterium]
MPLIRGIRAWFDRRMSDASMAGMAAADGGASLSSASWLWLIVFIILVPVIAVLVLIGLIYEIVIRIDQHRLGPQVEWLLSSAAGILIVVGLYWVFLRR